MGFVLPLVPSLPSFIWQRKTDFVCFLVLSRSSGQSESLWALWDHIWDLKHRDLVVMLSLINIDSNHLLSNHLSEFYHWNAALLLFAFASLNRRHSESKLLFSFKSSEEIRWELRPDVEVWDELLLLFRLLIEFQEIHTLFWWNLAHCCI